MFKLLSLTFFVMISILSNSAYAQKTITLNANEAKSLANPVPWTVKATCNIHGTVKTHSKIRIVVLKNQGVVNGKNLSTGQGTSVTVRNNSNISVSAEAGTEINLINLSSEGLQAVCNT